MSGLTFDWDDTDLENPVVVKALNYLEDEFGWGKVWVIIPFRNNENHFERTDRERGRERERERLS